ncbi:MAG: biotin transporter BioY [Chloroflexi bacterium]|nr:biotin transporter BioY [Chloroflexota bacterium]
MHPTYMDVFRPAKRRDALLYDMSLILFGSILIALSAQVAIRLPFNPVPITGQTFAVLLLAALLGRVRGAAAVLTYLAEGALGFPVFAGGAGGFYVLLGPTAGYLFGFVVAAFLVGWLAERGWDRGFSSTIAAMFMGNVAIYGFGALWLGLLIGLEQAIVAGVLPFLLGDALKMVAAALALPLGWRLIGATHKMEP